MANQQAPRDVNRVTTLLGVDDVTGETRPLLVDNATGRLLISATGGGGTPGGLDTQVQYNNAGAFGGTDLLYSNATGNYALGTTLSTTDSLKFVKTLTPAAGTTVGMRIESYSDASASGTVHVGQLLLGGTTAGNIRNFNQLGGSQSAAVHAGTGVVSEAIGSISDTLLSGSGNATWAYAAITRIRGTSTGIYASGAIGLWVLSPQLSGGASVANLYGIYMSPQTSGLGANYAFYYANTTSGFYITGDGKTGIGVESPTYRLDVGGDVRVTATTNQQWIYVNNSPTEGLKAHRIEISSATGTINYSGIQAALTSGVAKTAGNTIGFEVGMTVNAGDNGGSYIAFSSGNIAATASTATGLNVGTGWDNSIVTASGNVTLVQSAFSTGTPTAFSLTTGLHTGLTASTEVNSVKVDLAAIQTWATGDIQIQRFYKITQPTIAFAAASSVTVATATVAIDGAPLQGTNATISGASVNLLVGGIGTKVNAATNVNLMTLNNGVQTGKGAITDHVSAYLGYGGGNIDMGDQVATTTRFATTVLATGTLFTTGGAGRTVTDAITLDIEGAFKVANGTTITNGPYALRVSGVTTLKNIAGSVTRAVHIPDYTVTLSATTQITSTGMAAVGIGQVTLAQSGGAVTVDNFASLYVKGAGIAGASVTMTNNYSLWTDAGTVRHDGSVIIQDSTTPLTITQSIATTGSPIGLSYTGAAHTTLTASTEVTDVKFDLSRTVQLATGNYARQRAVRIEAPTYGFVAASTVSVAATVAIDGPPISGTNASLQIETALFIGGSSNIRTTSTTYAGGQVIDMPGIADGIGSTAGLFGFLAIGAVNGTSDNAVMLGNQTATTDFIAVIAGSSINLESTTNVRTITSAYGGLFGMPGAASSRVQFTNGPYALAAQPGSSTIYQTASQKPAVIAITDLDQITFGNTTQVTSTGPAGIYIPQIYIGQSGGAMTVDNTSSLYIEGPMVAQVGVTLTNKYSIWVDDGPSRFDDRVLQFKGADTASANDLTLPKGNLVGITGATQINAITTAGWTAGSTVTLDLAGAPLIKHNTAGGAGTAAILLNGSVDWTPAGNGGLLTLIYNGTNWKEISRLDP